MEVHRTKSPPLSPLQAGGHGSDKSVVFEGPQIKKIASGDELKWYESLRECVDSDLSVLVEPKYLGKETQETRNGKDITVIHLENLLFGFICPCVLDLKLGTCTVTSTTEEAKRRRHELVDSLSTTRTLGFRFSGMVLTCPEAPETPYNFGKYWSERVSAAEIWKSVALFFTRDPKYAVEALTDGIKLPSFNEDLGVIKKRINCAADQTKTVEMFLASTGLKIYGASLLIVYDSSCDNIRVKLIDYAHVFKPDSDEKDSGALVGVRNIISLLAFLSNTLS